MNNTITLPTGGGKADMPKCYPNVIAHLTEKPPDRFQEVAVSRDARGNYYCSFVYEDSVNDEVNKKNEIHKKQKKGNSAKTVLWPLTWASKPW